MTPPRAVEALKRPAATCAKCGAPLEDLPKHESRLAKGGGETDVEELERQDFCDACQAEARAGEYHSRWRAQRPAPPPPRKRETRKAQATRLREEFYRLADIPEPTPEDEDSLYLAAHLLMKVGGFKWRETDTAQGVLIFEDVSNQQRIEVPDVTLDAERLAAAQERLNALL